jgi:serine/threonine protein kinase/tetratricopeptide (TPR) repeat protein
MSSSPIAGVPQEAASERLQEALAGRYLVEHEAGHGGMATVYRARDLRHGRHVAIKVLHPELATSVGSERFLHEIQTAAQLTHPHILALYDSGDADGLLYYIMPFVEGESLHDRLEREGRLPVGDALRLACQVADALAFAHGRGIVHRDIKPENILLASPSHACVADFGLARALFSASSRRLTATGLVVGSPLYMSPEQIAGERHIDGRADVYALGCLLFEMLTGRPPYEGASMQTILGQHLTAPVPSARALRPEVPEAVDRAVRGAMAKAADERPADAKLFLKALEPIPKRIPLPTALRVSGERVRQGRIAAPSIVAVAGAILVALFASSMLRVSDERSLVDQSGITVVVMPIGGSQTATDAERALSLQASFVTGLEIVPGLRTMDGRALLKPAETWRGLPLHVLAQRAADVRGRYLITIELMAGPLTSIVVDLYEAKSSLRLSRRTGSVAEGSVRMEVQRLALELAFDLARLEGIETGLNSYLISSASSPIAIEHFLTGRSRMRSGDIDGAAEDFRRAIVEDSAFAASYFYLSVVETWSPRTDFPASLLAIEAGLRQKAEMPPQMVRLLEAQRHFVMREASAGLHAFERLTAEAPQLMEAWWGLGEMIFHSGGFLGLSPLDALPAFERVVLLDSTFTQAYDHLTELAVLSNDSTRAFRYVTGVRGAHRRTMNAALVIQFGTRSDVDSAFAALATVDRRTISDLVRLFGTQPSVVDALGSILQRPGRTKDDHIRGSQYRLSALAASGNWREAIEAWQAGVGNSRFDPWLVHAFLGGHPAAPEVRPMLRWADQRLRGGESPQLRSLTGEADNAFRARVHLALLEGQLPEVRSLLERLEPVVSRADRSNPEPSALQATLWAREAILLGDTARAVEYLEKSLERVPWGTSFFTPLLDAAPQRLMLAHLAANRDDSRAARRWLESFGRIGAVGDLLFQSAVQRLEGGSGESE